MAYTLAAQVSEVDRLRRGEHRQQLTFYRLRRQHHKHLKSTNMLERLNEELRRRKRVVRIFPNAVSCLRSDPRCVR